MFSVENIETASRADKSADIEAWPAFSYLRNGRPELAGRKLIKCPYCTELLTDVDRNTNVQIYRLSKGKQQKPIPGLKFQKCPACKNEVGLVIK